MKAIGSSTESYVVYRRGMTPLHMNAERGKKLDDYLLTDDKKDFVRITDLQGNTHTVRTSLIENVEPVRTFSTTYKTIQELRLPELVKDDYQERVWR